MERMMRYFKEHHGKDISCFQTDFLLRMIENRMAEAGISSKNRYFEELENNSEEAEAFIHLIYIAYSEFFREPSAFWALEKQILPKLQSRKKAGSEIRIWSVGCAIGQEPYSIAMMVNEIVKRSKLDVKVRIFASDLSESYLERARQGRYSRLELKQLSLGYLDQYFTKVGDEYEVIPTIKQLVTFSCYDILDEMTLYPAESIYGSFDIIFCRNLLIYYQAECQKHILDKLQRALGHKGYLITGEAERATVEKWSNHRPLTVTGAVFQSMGGWNRGGIG